MGKFFNRFGMNAGKQWELKTGNLVTMTSDTSPAPFTVTTFGTGTIKSGSPYQMFDNNANTEIDTTGSGQVYTIFKLNFGKKIKIKKIYINSGSTMNSSNPKDKGVMITTNATSASNLGTTLVALSGEYDSGTTGVTKTCLQPDLETDNICVVVAQIGHTVGMRDVMVTE